MMIITVILGVLSIKALAKKIGGVFALILVFIPVWGTLLLLGIALLTLHMKLLNWLGIILLFFFVIFFSSLFVFGTLINNSIKNKNSQSKKRKSK
jgi:hypothetical protein